MPKLRSGQLPAHQHVLRTEQGRVKFPEGYGEYLTGPRGSWPRKCENAPPGPAREYDRLCAEWLAAKAAGLPAQRKALSWTCADVARGYLASLKDRPGQANATRALRPLLDLYGHTQAGDFDARRFVTVRQQHLDGGAAPRTVNDYAGFVRAAFRWAARPEQKGVPPAVALELSLVAALVDEDDVPLEDVPEATVRLILPHCAPVVADMLEVQMLTGMRPGELVRMKAGEVDQNAGEGLWLYKPPLYKSRRHASVRAAGGREVWIGPKAQALLSPWLEGKVGTDPVFPSRFRGCYSVQGYRKAVVEACDRAGVERFQPRQIRHTALTAVEGETGSLDAAQAVGGHRRPETTRRYAHAQRRLAKETMKRMG